MSERFRLPDEALPSEPPPRPEPAAPLGESEKTPAAGTATAHIPIPEKIKLLNAALPTPQSFQPTGLPIPKDAPLPQIEAGDEGEDASRAAPAASERPTHVAVASASRRRSIASAVALFVFLVSASALAIRLFDQFLFQ